MRYVTMWRMHKARELLATSASTIADVAATIGYESEFAFAKAFKRTFDVGPGAFRRTHATR